MICAFPEKRSDGQSSFRDAIEYAIFGKRSKRVDPDERVLYSGTKNMSSSQYDKDGKYNLKPIYEEMFLTSLRKKGQAGDPVVHCILSWRDGEEPTREQYEEAVDIWAKEQGLEECQMFWAVHRDTDNFHLDVVANRIDPVTFYAAPMHFRFKANERAARKIEIAQGWALEKSGHLAQVEEIKNALGAVIGHRVVEHGTKMTPEEKAKTEHAISKRARDSEVRTGEKSAERIAKEVAAPVIFSAQSWADLHASLAEKGIRLEKKGSGGILYIGDQPVKLSVASKQCGFSKIVSRLGDFQPRDPAIEIKKFVPVLTEKAKESSGRAAKIREYNDLKRSYYEKKREANAALWTEITKVRADFRAQKKERRAALYGEKKQNPDFNLKLQLSQLALEMSQKAEQIAEEIEKKKKKYKELFGGRWPSYEDWLRCQQLYSEAEFWRYQFNVSIFLGDFADYNQYDLGGYSAKIIGKAVRYDRGERVAFVDKGNFISVFESQNSEIVWDGLKMAQQKWGAFNINGSKEFKSLCIDLIARHDEYYIRLKDPEQQLCVEERRREIAEERKRERKAIEVERRRLEAEEREAKERVELERRQKMSPLELALEEVKTGGRRETPQLIAAAQAYIDLDPRQLEEIMKDNTLPLIVQRLAQKKYMSDFFASLQSQAAVFDGTTTTGKTQPVRDKSKGGYGDW